MDKFKTNNDASWKKEDEEEEERMRKDWVLFESLPSSFQPDSLFKKVVTDRRTDQPTDGPTDGQTHPLIEMRGRI